MNRKLLWIGLVCLITLYFVADFTYAQDSRPIVRVVYRPLPGSPPRPNVNAEIDALIKETQLFFADEMERHGFGRKTFQFEADASGNTVVHHGELDSPRVAHHGGRDIGKDIEVYMAEEKEPGVCGRGGGGNFGGFALIFCWNLTTIAHELGHAFGLQHDFRAGSDIYIMSYGLFRHQLSKCTAEWLNVHRAFNPNPSAVNTNTKVEMFPPSLAAPPNVIRLRFKVADPDGLHQVQLLTSTLTGVAYESSELVSYKPLNGSTNTTVEFVTTDLTPESPSVSLQVVDVHGNAIWSRKFPINITSLLPRAKVVSISDANLAAAVQRVIGNTTTHSMLNLRELAAHNNGIRNLAGLEHAHNLRGLHLTGNNISDVSALSELTNLTYLDLDDNNISDVSALSELTQLNLLHLKSNNISDVSALSELTNLTYLDLDDNNISDVSALSELTQLTWLYLDSNNISDVSALSELTQLTWLYLDSNNISDVSPLQGMTELRTLYLWNNSISDVSALSELTQLTWLYLDSNNISDVSPLLALNLIGTQSDSTGLYLQNNPLSYDSINTHIPAMQAKGIEVSFDNVVHPALSIVSGNNQEGFAGSVLLSPFVAEAQNENGEPMEGIPVTFTVETGNGQLTSPTTTTDADGRAQTNLMLGWTPGRNTVRVTGEGIESWATFSAIGIEPETQIAADVNRDGAVDVEDLVLVAATLGTTPPDGTIPNTDVNGDGVINSDDLALVMAALETTPAAPATVLTAENLQRWIDEAKQLANKDVTFLRGIEVLEQLLASMLPKKTTLLANYPNPFNPETWIPYHLAKPAEVTVRIYGVNGTLIRTLALGHKPAGIYEHRKRAAYWDGKNAQGERVASGIYFYALTAGDFTSTRKMLIRK